VYAVDPGDMRTQMHQEAFPGEDIRTGRHRKRACGGLLALIEGDHRAGAMQQGARAMTVLAAVEPVELPERAVSIRLAPELEPSNQPKSGAGARRRRHWWRGSRRPHRAPSLHRAA